MAESYRLTDPQYAMLADSFNTRGYGLWNMQLTFTMREPLDVPRFKSAWQQVVERHPALRTRIVFSDQSPPVQRVEDDVHVSVEALDWTGRPAPRIEEEVRGHLVGDRRGPRARNAARRRA